MIAQHHAVLCRTFLVVISATISDGFGLTSSSMLPKLFQYDDFDECRTGNPHFEYCIVDAVVQPNEKSNVWSNISALSSDSRNFPHDHLERGVCLSKCLKQFVTLGEVDTDHAMEEIEGVAMDESKRLEYLSWCVNLELQKSFKLEAKVSVLNCMSEKDFERGVSMSEKIFLSIILTLVVLVGVATFFDFNKVNSQYNQFVLPFSISRNIGRLLDTSKTDGSLSHLEGLRAIYMLIILIVHSSLPMLRLPLKNVEDVELQTNSFIFPFVNSGNTHMIMGFFALGGMVLSISFLRNMERAPKFEFNHLWKKLLHRLARILPAYALVIFFQATLFERLKQTPVAFKFVDYCREHWWSNLLFINNFVHLDEPCLKFGWYLGADFQLFLFGMVIMSVIWRFSELKKVCVGLMLFISFVIPGFVIYKEGLEATLTFNMKHALSELREYDFFLKYYTQTYTNAGTYFFGIIAGMLYHYISRNSLHSHAEFHLKRVIAPVLMLFFSLNGFLTVFPSLQLERPSLFLAVFGSALKAIWGIFHATLFLLFAFKTKSVVVAFLEHPVFNVLGKLSYTIYITQYAVIYTIYSNVSVPITYGSYNMFFLTSAIIFITFCGALLLHLLVEVPCASVLKQLIDSKRRTGSLSKEEQKRDKSN